MGSRHTNDDAQVWTPWGMALFHMSDKWCYGLIRMRGNEVHPTARRAVTFEAGIVQAAYVAENGGVNITDYQPDFLRHIAATNTKTTAEEYLKYLRRVYAAQGGNDGARVLFGARASATPARVQRHSPALDALYWDTAKKLEVEEATLRGKFGHMNAGMQAMQLRGLQSKASGGAR